MTFVVTKPGATVAPDAIHGRNAIPVDERFDEKEPCNICAIANTW